MRDYTERLSSRGAAHVHGCLHVAHVLCVQGPALLRAVPWDDECGGLVWPWFVAVVPGGR